MKIILFFGLIAFGVQAMDGNAEVIQDTVSDLFFLAAAIIFVGGMLKVFAEAFKGN